MQAALAEGDTGQLVFFAFDLLHARGEDLRPLRLSERKARLQAFLSGKGSRGGTPPNTALVRYVDHFDTGGDAVLLSACKLSLEGIVSKQANAPLPVRAAATPGSRAKCRGGHELVIGAWTDTGGQFRSLMVGVNRGNSLRPCGPGRHRVPAVTCRPGCCPS